MPPKRKATENVTSNKKKSKVLEPIKKSKTSIKVLSKKLNYSLCIPTTILANCTNLEQITYVVYQIAKAATIFNAGEIVILDMGDRKETKITEEKEEKKKKKTDARLSDSMLIASLLQYFVTPPYLVSTVFKKQFMKYFTVASKLPRLSALPFMRYLNEDNGRYREGLAIRMTKPGSNSNSKKEFKQTKYINIGKEKNLELKKQLVPVNVRVTVDTIENRVVSPEEAYGDYVGAQASYGYHVRIAKTFGDIFTQCAFPSGYSQTVWVNSGDYYYDEKLKKYSKVESKIPGITKIVTGGEIRKADDGQEEPVDATNLLIVYGKWDHIKRSFQESKEQFEGCEGAHEFFDGQFELPGTAPAGNISIQDSCMISLATIPTLL